MLPKTNRFFRRNLSSRKWLKRVNGALACRFLLFLLALHGCGDNAALADFSYGPVSLSAFGTLGGAWLGNKHVDFTQGLQPTGAGRTHNVDLALDSRLGAQLSFAAATSTLITAQTVVERLSDTKQPPAKAGGFE